MQLLWQYATVVRSVKEVMSSNQCPHCGESIPKDAYICPKSRQLADKEAFWAFCEHGARTMEPERPELSFWSY